MAENSKGGFINKTEKFLRRRKTKVLQSLGKTGKTTDEQLQEDSIRLEKQQEIANKFQKDLRHYIHSARALALASKTFYTTLSETYEADWEGYSQVNELLTSVDVLWQDYLQKIQEQVQDPLTKYLSFIPQIKARVAKRGRKLIDYDNARHNLEVQQNAKKKDDAKVAKAQEDLEQAKRIYDQLNNELHTELPEFYNNRVMVYGKAFQHMFEAEHVFHQELGKVWADAPACEFEAPVICGFTLGERFCSDSGVLTQGPNTLMFLAHLSHSDKGADRVAEVGAKLVQDNESFIYTPRKNVRHTISQESDEHVPNGHGENGNSGYESPHPESPITSSSQEKAPEPESPGPSPVPSPVKADVTIENGEKEADTSKESVEGHDDYENAHLGQQQSSRQSVEVQEVNVTPNEVATSEQVTQVNTSESETVQSTASVNIAKIDLPITTDESLANEIVTEVKAANENMVDKSAVSEDKDISNADNENIVAKTDERENNAAPDVLDAAVNKMENESNKMESETSHIDKDESVKEIKEPDGVKVEVLEPKSDTKILETDDEKTVTVEVEKTEKVEPTEPKEEPKVNGVDLDSSGEQEVPDHPPPPPPMSEPPTELQESPKEEKSEVVNAVNDDDDDANRDSLYQVPPPAKRIDDLPPHFIKTVITTHPYTGEDEDELSFESGEVIDVVAYDDPDEQDPGWLMGIRKSDNKKGVFPENFTKPV